MMNSIRRRVGRFSVVLVLVGSAAGALPITSAVASSSAPVASEDWGAQTVKQMQAQETLMGLRGWMMDQPEYADGEFVSATDNLDAVSTEMLWYGDSPFLQKVKDEAARRGITVTVKPALFDRQTLLEESTKLLDTDTSAQGLAPQVVVGDDDNFDGLVVRTALDGDNAPSTDKSAVDASLQRAEATLQAASRFPVKVELSEKYIAGSRSLDTSPFNAGGYMLAPGGHTCSSGFAIKISGTAYTSNARHCTFNSYYPRDGTSSTLYGGTKQVVALTQWRVLQGHGHYWMFDGPLNTNNHKTVSGYGDVAKDDIVFMAGGNSGTHPNLKVTSLAASWNDGYGVEPQIEAQAPGGKIAAMAGDSGGPVFVYRPPPNDTKVYASGMFQAFNTTVTSGGCGSARDANPCGNKLLFTSAHATVNSIAGASLYTG